MLRTATRPRSRHPSPQQQALLPRPIPVELKTQLGDPYDWTTGAPHDGNEWKKYVSYLVRTPRTPFFMLILVGPGSKGAFSFPGSTWDCFRCTVEPSPGHIWCRSTPPASSTTIWSCPDSSIGKLKLHIGTGWRFFCFKSFFPIGPYDFPEMSKIIRTVEFLRHPNFWRGGGGTGIGTRMSLPCSRLRKTCL